MPPTINIDDIADLVGSGNWASIWMEMPQTRIDVFAEATDDRQFIHVDPQAAAAKTPFGGAIAHGFLTLSMLSAMHEDCVPRINGQIMGINFGFNKVRFMNPVASGSRIRGKFLLTKARRRGLNFIALNFDISIEIEGQSKPALTAEWLTLSKFDPELLQNYP